MSLPHVIPDERPASAKSTEQWFADEVQPHESGLRAWLRSRFPSLDDFDDIVQESYYRLVRAKAAGKVRLAKPYLYSTARNAALDFFRRERVVPMERIAEMDELRVLDGGSDALELLTREEDLVSLSEAIQALPERCREILVLRKLHGLSQKEIAAKLGLSENTVAAQASAGVRRCMEYFRERNLKR